MGPPCSINPMTYCSMSERSYHGATSCSYQGMNELIDHEGFSVDKTCPSLFTHTHKHTWNDIFTPCTYIRFKIRVRFRVMFIVGIIFRVRMFLSINYSGG